MLRELQALKWNKFSVLVYTRVEYKAWVYIHSMVLTSNWKVKTVHGEFLLVIVRRILVFRMSSWHAPGNCCWYSRKMLSSSSSVSGMYSPVSVGNVSRALCSVHWPRFCNQNHIRVINVFIPIGEWRKWDMSEVDAVHWTVCPVRVILKRDYLNMGLSVVCGGCCGSWWDGGGGGFKWRRRRCGFLTSSGSCWCSCDSGYFTGLWMGCSGAPFDD